MTSELVTDCEVPCYDKHNVMWNMTFIIVLNTCTTSINYYIPPPLYVPHPNTSESKLTAENKSRGINGLEICDLTHTSPGSLFKT